MKDELRKAPLITALEQRILLDAAGALTGVELLDDDGTDKAASIAEAEALAPQTRERRELAFVDGGLEDVDILIADLADSAEVVVIDPAQDGYKAMAAYLNGQSGVDAVHVFGHGTAGQATLGTATLNAGTLDAYADELRGIGASLTEAGDILLYGCHVGAGAEGEAFVEDIAALTAADVAASDDLTGAADLGGDWELEVSEGAVEATALASAEFEETLSFSFTITIDNDNQSAKTYSGSGLSGSKLITTSFFDGDGVDETLSIASATAGYTWTIEVSGESPEGGGKLTHNGSGQDTNLTVGTTETLSWTAQEINQPPIPTTSSISATEDTTATGTLTGSDPNGDSLGFEKTGDPSHGTLTINSNGSYSYRPDTNYNGADSFTYRVNDGEFFSASETVTVNIAAVNDAPSISSRSRTGDEFDGSLPINISASDIDGDTLTFSAGSGFTVSNSADTVAFNPSEDSGKKGTYTFSTTVTASDGSLTDTATYTWNITYYDDGIVWNTNAKPGDQNWTGSGEISFDWSSGAEDLDNADSPVYLSTQGALFNGSNSSGDLSGNPGVSHAGVYSFTGTATEPGQDKETNRGSNSITADFEITVGTGILDNTNATNLALNDAPVSSNDAVTIDEDTPYILQLPDVDDETRALTIGETGNDFGAWSDADYAGPDDSVDESFYSNEDRVKRGQIKLESLPTHGDLFYKDDGTWTIITASDITPGAAREYISAQDVYDGKLRYDPDPNYNRFLDDPNGQNLDSFDFRVNDGLEDAASANTLTIYVEPINDAPVMENAESANNDPSLTDITENETTNGGNLVADLVRAVSADGYVVGDADTDDTTTDDTDANPATQEIDGEQKTFATDVDFFSPSDSYSPESFDHGIAIYSTGMVGPGDGVWEFSIDGGATWFTFSDALDGSETANTGVSTSSALLLRSTDLIRVRPDGDRGNGGEPAGSDYVTGAEADADVFLAEQVANPTNRSTFDYYLWDGSSGTAGTTADASTRGGTTAFSTDSDTASIRVTDVNDPPVLNDLAGDTTTLDMTGRNTDNPAGAAYGISKTQKLDAGALATISDRDNLDDEDGNNNSSVDYAGYVLTVKRNLASYDVNTNTDVPSEPTPSDGSGTYNDRFGLDTNGAGFTLSSANGDDQPVTGSYVQYNGTNIAKVVQNEQGLLKLEFMNNGSGDAAPTERATQARVDEILQSITYQADRPAGDADFRITLTDAPTPASASSETDRIDVTVESTEIYVTQMADDSDAAVAGGSEAVDLSDGVSLREAVVIADQQGGGDKVIHIPGGTHVIDRDLTVGSTNITLQLDSDTTIEVAAGASLTVEAQVTGSGSLIKTGNGELTLDNSANGFASSPDNTDGNDPETVYAFGLELREGTLTLKGGSAVADTAAVVVSPGTTLNVKADETIGSLETAGDHATTPGDVVLHSGHTLTLGVNGVSTTYAGVISDNDEGSPGSVIKDGDGTLTLTGGNTFSGGLTIQAGTLDTTGGGTLADDVPVVVNADARYIVGTADTIGDLTIDAIGTGANAGTVDINADLTVRDASNAGSSGDTDTADSDVVATLDNQGIINLAADLIIASGASGTPDGKLNNDGLLIVSGDRTISLGTLIDENGQGTIRVSDTDAGTASALTLAQTGISTFHGIFEGGSNDGTGNGTAQVRLDQVSGDDGELTLTGSSLLSGAFRVIDGVLTLEAQSNNAEVLADTMWVAVGSQGTLQVKTDETLRALGDNTGSTANTNGADGVEGDASTGEGLVVIDNGIILSIGTDGSFDTAFSGQITGGSTLNSGGSLHKIGSNTIRLANAASDSVSGNDFTGTTKVLGGRLIVDGEGIGDLSMVTVDGDGKLELTASEEIGSLETDASDGDTSGNEENAEVVLTGGSTVLITGGNNLSTTFKGLISGEGGVHKIGNYTFTVDRGSDSQNTFSADLTIEEGTVELAGGGAIADSTSVVLERPDSGKNVKLLVRASEEINSLSSDTPWDEGSDTAGQTTVVEIASNQTLKLDDRSDATYYGQITGAGGLEKIGTATFTLDNYGIDTEADSPYRGGTETAHESHYTGATDIKAGTLIATGHSIGDQSAVTIYGGATLQLNGTEEIGSLASADTGSQQANVVIELAGTAGDTGADNNGSTPDTGATLITGGNDTDTVFAGEISGEGGLIKEGDGEFTLNTTGLAPGNTFSGPLTINDGAVTTEGGTSIGDDTPVIVNDDGESDPDNGGKLNINDSEEVGSLSGDGDVNIGGDSRTRDGLRIRLEGALTTRLDDLIRVDDTITYTLTLENITGSDITVDGVTEDLGNLSLVILNNDGASAAYTLDSEITIAAGATATITGVYSLTSADLDGDDATGNEGALNAIGNVFTVKRIDAENVDLSESTPLTSGEPADTLTVSGTDPVEDPIPPYNGETSGPGGLVVEGPGGFDNGGTLGHDGGTVINGGGTLDNSGTISGDGDIDVDDGTFTNSGDVEDGESGQGGDVNVGEDGELENKDGGTIAGDVTNDGGEVTNEEGGTIEGGVTNDGGTVDNDGTIKGNVENDDGDFDNDGTIEGDVTNRGDDGDFDNGKGGVIEGDVDNEDSNLNNDGEIKGDVTTDGGDVTNGGDVQGGVTVDGGGTFDNTGTIGGTRVQAHGLDILLTSELDFGTGDADAVDAGDEINYTLVIENTTGSSISIGGITTAIGGVADPVTFVGGSLTIGPYDSTEFIGTYVLAAADINGDPNDGNAGNDEDIDLDVTLAGGGLSDHIVLSDQTRLNTEETNVAVEDGEFNNEGTVNGDVIYTPPQGSYTGDGEVTGTVGPEELVVSLDGMVDITNGIDNDRVDAGDVITYRLAVTNNSVDGRSFDNVSIVQGLDNASGDTDLAELLSDGVNIGDINSNGQLDKGETWVYEGNLTLGGNDFDGDETTGRENAAGDIEQAVEVEAKGTDETLTRSAVETTRLVAVPKMHVSTSGRLVDVNGDGIANAGDRIDYTTVLANTGNVFLSGLTLSDSIAAFEQTEDDGNGNQVPVPTSDADEDGKIRVGEAWSFQSSYTLTDEDISSNAGGNGLIENTVVAGAAELDNSEFATDAVALEIPPAKENRSTFNPSGKAPSLKASLFGTIDPAVAGDPETIEAGDTITYRLILENTGDTGLTDIALEERLFNAISDSDFDLSSRTGDDGVDGVIDPGETWVVDGATLTLTEDALAGNGLNVAGISDNDGDIDQKVVISSETLDADVVASVATRLMIDPELEVTVDSRFVEENSGKERLSASEGDDLVYTVKVRNSGNTAVTGIAASSGLTLDAGFTTATSPTELDSGEVLVFSGTYGGFGGVVRALAGNGLNASGVADDDGDIDNIITVTSDNAAAVVASDEIDLVFSQRGASAGGAEDVASPSVDLRLSGNLDTSSDTAAASGDAIDYLLTVENTGNRDLTNLDLASDIALSQGWTLLDTSDGFGDLDGDGILDINETWAYSARHSITSGASVTNNVSLNSPNLSGVETVSETTNFRVTRDLNVSSSHRIVDSDGNERVNAAIGDKVEYTVVVENVGNDPLTNVVVTDPLLGGELTLDRGDLVNPGELDAGERWLYTGAVDVTAEILGGDTRLNGGLDAAGELDNDGDIDNTVTAVTDELPVGVSATGVVILQGADPAAGELNGPDDVVDPAIGDDSNTNGNSNAQGLQVRLYGSLNPQGKLDGTDALEAGDTIDYWLALENTSGTAISIDSIVIDVGSSVTLGGTGFGDTPDMIAAGESVILTASYVLADADVGATVGDITKTLTLDVTGSTDTVQVTDTTRVNQAIPAGDDQSVLTREVTVTKSGLIKDSEGNLRANASGDDQIDYTITVQNSGNVALHNLVATDSLIPLSRVTGAEGGDMVNSGVLDVGEIWVYTGTLTDLASALAGNGLDVDGLADNDGDIDNAVTIAADDLATPGFAKEETVLSAQADAVDPGRVPSDRAWTNADGLSVAFDGYWAVGDADQAHASVGDTIEYRLVVANNSDHTYSNLGIFGDSTGSLSIVTDNKLGGNTDDHLDGGETWIYTGSYVLTADHLNGQGADAAGNADGDGDIDQAVILWADGGNTEIYATESTTLSLSRELSATLSGTWMDAPPGTQIAAAGDTVNYVLTLENAGNVKLTGVSVDAGGNLHTGDPGSGGLELDIGTRTLVTGETQVLTGSYVLSQDDLDSNGVNAEGVADGDGDIDQLVTIKSDNLGSDVTVTEATRLALTRSLEVTKTAKILDSEGNSRINTQSVGAGGDQIEYVITATNTGNVLITGVSVEDPLLGGNLGLPDNNTDRLDDGRLSVGETWVWTPDRYAITQADLDGTEAGNAGADGDIDNTVTVLSNEVVNQQASVETVLVPEPIGKTGEEEETTETSISTVGGLILEPDAIANFDIAADTLGNYDQFRVTDGGQINLNGAELRVNLIESALGGGEPYIPGYGETFKIIDNNTGNPVEGLFTYVESNDAARHTNGTNNDVALNNAGDARREVEEGDILRFDGYDFRVSYSGGEGNDVVLTRVNMYPEILADVGDRYQDADGNRLHSYPTDADGRPIVGDKALAESDRRGNAGDRNRTSDELSGAYGDDLFNSGDLTIPQRSVHSDFEVIVEQGEVNTGRESTESEDDHAFAVSGTLGLYDPDLSEFAADRQSFSLVSADRFSASAELGAANVTTGDAVRINVEHYKSFEDANNDTNELADDPRQPTLAQLSELFSASITESAAEQGSVTSILNWEFNASGEQAAWFDYLDKDEVMDITFTVAIADGAAEGRDPETGNPMGADGNLIDDHATEHAITVRIVGANDPVKVMLNPDGSEPNVDHLWQFGRDYLDNDEGRALNVYTISQEGRELATPISDADLIYDVSRLFVDRDVTEDLDNDVDAGQAGLKENIFFTITSTKPSTGEVLEGPTPAEMFAADGEGNPIWGQLKAEFAGGTMQGMLPGLTLDMDTGVISGRPIDVGTYVIEVTAIDTDGATATRSFELLIVAPPQPEVPRLAPQIVDPGGPRSDFAVSEIIREPIPSGRFTAFGFTQAFGIGESTVLQDNWSEWGGTTDSFRESDRTVVGIEGQNPQDGSAETSLPARNAMFSVFVRANGDVVFETREADAGLVDTDPFEVATIGDDLVFNLSDRLVEDIVSIEALDKRNGQAIADVVVDIEAAEVTLRGVSDRDVEGLILVLRYGDGTALRMDVDLDLGAFEAAGAAAGDAAPLRLAGSFRESARLEVAALRSVAGQYDQLLSELR